MGSIVPELLVALAHFIWTGGWWSFGHFIYLISVKCNEEGFGGCSGSDPIGFAMLFASSVLFFYISRHVLNFLYKGTLPGGDEMAKRFSKVMGETNIGKKNKRK